MNNYCLSLPPPFAPPLPRFPDCKLCSLGEPGRRGIPRHCNNNGDTSAATWCLSCISYFSSARLSLRSLSISSWQTVQWFRANDGLGKYRRLFKSRDDFTRLCARTMVRSARLSTFEAVRRKCLARFAREASAPEIPEHVDSRLRRVYRSASRINADNYSAAPIPVT